jgi:hypothetical protein
MMGFKDFLQQLRARVIALTKMKSGGVKNISIPID